MARVKSISVHNARPLETGWEVACLDADAAKIPAEIEKLSLSWQPAKVPGTVASALRDAGQWDFGHKLDFDKSDWWFRLKFDFNPDDPAGVNVLRFQGLATIAEVWLNGESVLTSENMFRNYSVDVTALLKEKNVLHIRFASLQKRLGVRRPRARWRTRLVEHQQLRWIRTSLLGRMPGWSPPVPAIGPWRPIVLETRRKMFIEHPNLSTQINADGSGTVRASLQITPVSGAKIRPGKLVVGNASAPIQCTDEQQGFLRVEAEVQVKNVSLWWPHTHGSQTLYPVQLLLDVDGSQVEVDLGAIGFRSIAVDQTDGSFGFKVNGTSVFCRGASWTTTDIVTLGGRSEDYRAALTRVKDAGMNMLRISGTMFYENDVFFDLCDELGILVWQDFMFANMDYPADDAAFVSEVEAEAKGFLTRHQARPCLALFCGNSEIEQQAAMLGLPRETWSNRLFAVLLPEWCKESYPGLPYIPSTPTGGDLPFQVNAGVSHYYGVGAYRRPPDDARRAEVRFASECLAFSNVPEPFAEKALLNNAAPGHDPLWKERVPRDVGSGWDFEDVRDFYMARMFSVDPVKIRSTDRERYLALARVTSGELMAGAFSEWRRAQSTCSGALVWFYQDLWPGAGWGLVDSSGIPKSPYYYLKRTFQPISTFFSDEGLNGLRLHVVNERAQGFEMELDMTFYRGDTVVDTCHTQESLPARASSEINVEACLQRFVDSTYAYRFGPPGHDCVVAVVKEKATGSIIGEAYHFPVGYPSTNEGDLGLEAQALLQPDGSYALDVHTKKFAYAVSIDAGTFLPNDNYFNLAPGATKRIILRGGSGALRGTIFPLNAGASTAIQVKTAASS